MYRSDLVDLFLVFFTPFLIIVTIYYVLYKKGKDVLLDFQILPTRLKISILGPIGFNVNYESIDSLEIVPYEKSFSATLRFNSRFTNDVIYIKRNYGLIKDLVIGPNEVNQFYEKLNSAVSEYKLKKIN